MSKYDIEKMEQTLNEMIQQRGYEISKKESNKETLVGIRGSQEKIVAFLTPVAKFSVGRVKEFMSLVSKMNSEMKDDIEIKRCIVVYTNTITPMAKKVVENSLNVVIELFTIAEMMYNITKHVLVPQHIRLDVDDATAFKKKFGIRFPTLLYTDKVSKFYGYTRGDVIKIIRTNNFVAYRIVR
jgi:DNA-directed RNA polymerases I, II, and III subunit RPABC1